jgi:hypothetical protein
MQATREPQPTPEAAPKPNITVYVVAVVAVLVVAGLGWYSLSPEPEPETAAVQPQVVELPEPVIEEPVEVAEQTESFEAEPEPTIDFAEPAPIEEPLPALDASDEIVEQGLLAITPVSAFAELLINQDIIRRFVIFTDNLANQQLAKNHQLIKAPSEPFSIEQVNGQKVASASSHKRYDIYTDVFIAIDVNQAIELYKKYKPLMQEVHAEIGYPDSDFTDTLLDAIDHLLATPEIAKDVSLSQPSVMYTYVDPRLEALSDVQKQLLRSGPTNVKQIKNKLRTFKRALNAL